MTPSNMIFSNTKTNARTCTRLVQPSTSARMSGMSLVEVLVSVLVLGIGLLGIAAMQSVALRGGQSSLETSQAVMQSTAIIEAMRANRAEAANYNTGAMVCTPGAGGTLAQNDLMEWITAMQGSIGGGITTCGQVLNCPDACEITVRWDDSRGGGSATRDIVTRTRI